MLETENSKTTRHEYKQQYLYIFKMTEKLEVEHTVRFILSLIQPNKSEVNITVNIARWTKFSTTPNSKKVSTDKCDIDGQPEIAVAIQTGSTYISDSMTDITTIPTANLGFLTTVSSQKVSTTANKWL